MRSMTLTGAALLVGALLAGCGDQSGPTAESVPVLTAAASGLTIDHFKESVPLEETVVNPCNGETIHFSGTGDGQGNTIVVSDNILHREIHAVITETGIGETTGATYTLHANYHEVFNSPSLAAPDFTFGVKDRGHVISTTPELSFTWLYTIHFLVTASGEFKITKDIEGDDSPIFECQG